MVSDVLEDHIEFATQLFAALAGFILEGILMSISDKTATPGQPRPLADIERTTTTTMIFSKPFPLGDEGETCPAGKYKVEIDEELLQGLSFPAYRRTGAVMQRIAEPAQAPTPMIFIQDLRQFDLILAAGEVVTDVDFGGPPQKTEQSS
jgi:hypothetical protein